LIGWFSCAFRNLGEKKRAGKSFNFQFLLLLNVILILAEYDDDDDF